MRTSAQPLEGNQVKLTVEVDEEDIRRAEDDTLRRLTREAQIPGFRPGKVPRRILEVRLGSKAIREEVLRDMLPRYYADAVEETELDVIAPPEIDVTAGEEAGPIAFDAVVEVRPKVSVVGYEGLVVTLPSPTPSSEDIDAQVDRLREQFAELNEVDRAAADGDLVTLDVHGSHDGEPAEGLTADDLVYEVGTGGIVAGIDERLRGTSVGDEFELDAEDAPGGPAHLKVYVKQVREKVLPDADDDFASDASEFETLAELRADLSTRMTEVRRLQANIALRERAVEALVELVLDEPPAVLVSEETERMVNDLVHRLSHQQASIEQYLEATGQAPDELIAELEEQAKKQVKADLALRALIEAEAIDVEEAEVDDEIVRIAEQEKQSPARVRSVLEQDGRISGLRSQMRSAKALTWLVEHVGIVDDEGNPMDRSALLLETPRTPDSPVPVASDGDTEETASAVTGEA
jgi:trigger factor